jgi:hypothetical protein
MNAFKNSLIGQCIHDISVHEFFQGIQTVFTTRGSHLHHSGSPSRIIPYLGIQGIQLPFKISCITLRQYFRRGSYQIPSYLVPHRHEHFFTGSRLLAPSFLFFLPHQQCFMRTFTAPSTMFRPQTSHGHPLLEVSHHWQLSSSTTPIPFYT